MHPCWKSSLHQLNYAQSIIAEGCISVGDFSVSSPVSNRDDYDIFISYSRRDKEFVSQLCEALTQANQKIWVDWNDIPPAEDWRQEIYRGIEAANNFVFIISPHSTSSVVCGEELDHAIKHGKRLVPIVRQDVGYDNIHPELGRINWIFFREDDEFDSAFRKLISAIETDLSYVREHTHLLVRARKWDKVGRNKSYLLQGSELNKAEQWLVEGESKQPIATVLHREYIKTSRQVETEREDAQMRLRRLTPQQVKNRQAILNKVRKFWVKGVLETSLHDQVLIELGLEERADAVVSAWNMELATADEVQKPLPKGTNEDLPKTEVVEEQRKQLFDAYIERMFRRPTRLKVEQRYSEAQTRRWLTWLAQRMVQQSQTVFLIEGMQPTWLQGKGKSWRRLHFHSSPAAGTFRSDGVRTCAALS